MQIQQCFLSHPHPMLTPNHLQIPDWLPLLWLECTQLLLTFLLQLKDGVSESATGIPGIGVDFGAVGGGTWGVDTGLFQVTPPLSLCGQVLRCCSLLPCLRVLKLCPDVCPLLCASADF